MIDNGKIRMHVQAHTFIQVSTRHEISLIPIPYTFYRKLWKPDILCFYATFAAFDENFIVRIVFSR